MANGSLKAGLRIFDGGMEILVNVGIYRILFFALILVAPGMVRAGEGASPVSARVLAETKIVQPGHAARVGVIFSIAPAWHIYWKNPGVSGLATKVKFNFPDGWIVGPTLYPVPERIVLPGNIIAFGYNGEVMLMADVTPPAGATEWPDFSATASWLMCNDVCVPGRVTVRFDAARGVDASVFATWRPRVPAPASSSNDLAGDAQTTESNGRYTLRLDFKQPVSEIEFFPVPDSALRLEETAVHLMDSTGRISTGKESGTQASISFRARILQGESLTNSVMPAVVAYTDANGNRRGIETEIAIVNN